MLNKSLCDFDLRYFKILTKNRLSGSRPWTYIRSPKNRLWLYNFEDLGWFESTMNFYIWEDIENRYIKLDYTESLKKILKNERL